AAASLNVHSANLAPWALSDSFTVLHDRAATVAAGVLSNDGDPDGDPVSASLVSGPSHGTLTLSADGSFVYSPSAGYHGADAFTYTASDGVNASAPATVSLTVKPADSAPVAASDSFSVAHDQELAVWPDEGVLANDTDADGDPLTASLASGPAHGTLTLNA